MLLQCTFARTPNSFLYKNLTFGMNLTSNMDLLHRRLTRCVFYQISKWLSAWWFGIAIWHMIQHAKYDLHHLSECFSRHECRTGIEHHHGGKASVIKITAEERRLATKANKPLQNYLEAVTCGIKHWLETDTPVHRSDFPNHPWFGDTQTLRSWWDSEWP